MYEIEVTIVCGTAITIAAIWGSTKRAMISNEVRDLEELLRKVLKEVSQ